MMKSLIMAALALGFCGDLAAEPTASEPSASANSQVASESALLVLERQIVLKQKERTAGKITPDAYREWEAKFRTTLTGVILRGPKSPENAAAVIRIQSMLGDEKSADASMERSLIENPANPALLLTKGQLLHKRGDFQGAAEHALLAWEKSGRTDKSAWALYQETKGRVLPSGATSHPQTTRNSLGNTVARNATKDPSSLYTAPIPKPAAVEIPSGASPDEGVPAGKNNTARLITLFGVTMGLTLIVLGALPIPIRSSILDPIAMWRKTDRAANRRKAVTPEQFLKYSEGRTLNDVMRDKDKNKTLPAVLAGGPLDEFRYVSNPSNPEVVLDMRHFLVVGRLGQRMGLLIEGWQASHEQDSAFQSQDLVSNYYGAKFFSKYVDSKPFSEQLEEFFKHPEKFDAPGWKAK